MKPILFNSEMVVSILNGNKTVTRRVIKPQPPTKFDFDNIHNVKIAKYPICSNGTYGECAFFKNGFRAYRIKLPYKVGDILYVRETWARVDNEIVYRADDEIPEAWHLTAWLPSIHMPKEAARIFLRVTDVRVERLQDITSEQLRKEGLTSCAVHCGDMEIAIEEWRFLWDSTIKKTNLVTYGWNANPWVWVIEFEKINKEDKVE